MPGNHIALRDGNQDFHLSSRISICYCIIDFLIRHLDIGCCKWDVLLNLPLHRVSKLARGHLWDFHDTNNHSSRSTDGDDSLAVVVCADKALYAAKRSGRNQVVRAADHATA